MAETHRIYLLKTASAEMSWDIVMVQAGLVPEQLPAQFKANPASGDGCA